jgi:putative transposase
MTYPLVREFAAGEDPRRGDLSGAELLQADVPQGAGDPASQRGRDDAHLINAAYDIHRGDSAFGYRIITDKLREEGIAAGDESCGPRLSSPRSGSGRRSSEGAPEPRGRSTGER